MSAKGKLHVLAMDLVEALATGDDTWTLATLSRIIPHTLRRVRCQQMT